MVEVQHLSAITSLTLTGGYSPPSCALLSRHESPQRGTWDVNYTRKTYGAVPQTNDTTALLGCGVSLLLSSATMFPMQAHRCHMQGTTGTHATMRRADHRPLWKPPPGDLIQDDEVATAGANDANVTSPGQLDDNEAEDELDQLLEQYTKQANAETQAVLQQQAVPKSWKKAEVQVREQGLETPLNEDNRYKQADKHIILNVRMNLLCGMVSMLLIIQGCGTQLAAC